jgi:hypothetical protein
VEVRAPLERAPGTVMDSSNVGVGPRRGGVSEWRTARLPPPATYLGLISLRRAAEARSGYARLPDWSTPTNASGTASSRFSSLVTCEDI